MPGIDPSLALSDYGPSLVGGIITLDDASFITKIGSHNALSRRHVAPDGPTLICGALRRLRGAVLPLQWQTSSLAIFSELPSPHLCVGRFATQQPSHWPLLGPAYDAPGLSRYGFPSGSCSHGLALVCPARKPHFGLTSFVCARLDTPNVAPSSVCVRSS